MRGQPKSNRIFDELHFCSSFSFVYSLRYLCSILFCDYVGEHVVMMYFKSFVSMCKIVYVLCYMRLELSKGD